MSVYEKLVEAEKLVKAGWTQDVCARDKYGIMVGTSSKNAVSFCVYGALMRVCDNELGATRAVFRAANSVLDISVFNDNTKTTHKDVLEAFKKAKQRAKERGL